MSVALYSSFWLSSCKLPFWHESAFCMLAPVLTATLSTSSDGVNVEAHISSMSGELLVLLIVPVGAPLLDLQYKIWNLVDADVSTSPLWHYYPGSQELYMSEPQIQFFDDGGHSVQPHAKLQPSAPPAQWPCMQWLASSCCLHRTANDSVHQEVPARLTMSRAPAGRQMQQLFIKISELEEELRCSGDIVNMELVQSVGDFIQARTQPLALGAVEALMCIRHVDALGTLRTANIMRSLHRDVRDVLICRCGSFGDDEHDTRDEFLERFHSVVDIYEKKHHRTIEDKRELRAQVLLAYHKHPSNPRAPRRLMTR